MKSKFILIGLVIVVIVAAILVYIKLYAGADTLSVGTQPIVISGTVTTPDGKPLQDALITVGADGTRTDGQGRFSILTVQVGDAKVRVVNNNQWYQTNKKTVTLSATTPVIENLALIATLIR